MSREMTDGETYLVNPDESKGVETERFNTNIPEEGRRHLMDLHVLWDAGTRLKELGDEALDNPEILDKPELRPIIRAVMRLERLLDKFPRY